MNKMEKTEENDQKWFQGQAFQREKEDPEFNEIARNFLCGEVLTRKQLSDKEKALITLVALTTIQTLPSIQTYTVAALRVGASTEEIKETLYQCAPYIGLERVQCALKEVNEAFRREGKTPQEESQKTVTEKTRFEKGLSVQQQIFEKENINRMRAAAPKELSHIQDYLSAWCFGDFYTRGTLDLKMRELITFCAISCLGGCEMQAKAHASANISVGNTREKLIAAITQCLPFIGFPRTLNAISCIDQVTKA